MSAFKVDFQAMPWDEGRPGVRMKTFCEATHQIRLVEFSTSEGFEHWCEEGHIGFVLAGGLEIEFQGTVVSYTKGDGLCIPTGSKSAHRAVSIIPGTMLFMVEELGEHAGHEKPE